MRDPRWGRNQVIISEMSCFYCILFQELLSLVQETYGEDPWLSGYLASGFVKGLQGCKLMVLKSIGNVVAIAIALRVETISSRTTTGL